MFGSENKDKFQGACHDVDSRAKRSRFLGKIRITAPDHEIICHSVCSLAARILHCDPLKW